MLIKQLKKYIINTLSLHKTNIILLKKYQIISITGKDCKKLLQNQITIDINSIKKYTHKLCAQCASNGKTIGILRIFKKNNKYYCIAKNDIINIHISIFKKYGIFSDIKIKKIKKNNIFGLINNSNSKIIYTIFPKLKNENLIKKKNLIILKIKEPITRFIIITKLKYKKIFENKIKKIEYSDNNNIWTALDISANIPIINKKNSKKFIPQEINLNNLNAININKGCYIGQEIITKMEYKKIKKNKMFFIVIQTYNLNNNIEVKKIIKKIKLKLKCKIIKNIIINNNEIWMQIVSKNKIYNNININIKKEQNKIIKIKKLIIK